MRQHPSRSSRPGWPRRELLRWAAGAGLGAVFGRALAVAAADGKGVTEAQIREAEWVAGLSLTPEERALMVEGVNERLAGFERMRAVAIDNGVSPSLVFDPDPVQPDDGRPAGRGAGARYESAGATARPAAETDLAFLPVRTLAGLLRERVVSSAELTRIYLERLRRFDPELRCVITLTERLALEQAERADREIAAGRWRGPLHGVPWGAKDLLAVPGYPTTWGAKPFREQVRPELATVAARLERAGAVLVAKLSLGALAWGDVWFGGKTRSPWDPAEGSSGSSAGSASATAAGLVAFALGSETWGSIVSPCTRCGCTGLRPTFGAVSRYGAMALSWSMDKLGPIARTVDDCAFVFDAIRGPDGLDPSVVERPFSWPSPVDPRRLRVGYLAELFEAEPDDDEADEATRARQAERRAFDRRTLDRLREIGFELVAVRLPEGLPIRPLASILTAEAAAAFDDLTRSGRDDELTRQVADAWPNELRQGQLIPAVEYLRANRIRRMLIEATERAMAGVDVWVAPSFGGDNLLLTNLTGHPAVVLPNGFLSGGGSPTSITFNGRLHGEGALLAVAQAYQEATDFHLERPPVGR